MEQQGKEKKRSKARKMKPINRRLKKKNDSCEIEDFCRNSSLQAAWDTSIARTTGLKGNKV